MAVRPQKRPSMRTLFSFVPARPTAEDSNVMLRTETMRARCRLVCSTVERADDRRLAREVDRVDVEVGQQRGAGGLRTRPARFATLRPRTCRRRRRRRGRGRRRGCHCVGVAPVDLAVLWSRRASYRRSRCRRHCRSTPGHARLRGRSSRCRPSRRGCRCPVCRTGSRSATCRGSCRCRCCRRCAPRRQRRRLRGRTPRNEEESPAPLEHDATLRCRQRQVKSRLRLARRVPGDVRRRAGDDDKAEIDGERLLELA